jgi:NTE family protein
VGAINAACYASLAQLGAREQCDGVLERWRGLRKGDVIAPIVGSGGARMILRLLGHSVRWPGARLASVLDPTPLAASLDSWIDWHQIEANVKARRAAAVCVVATLLSSGRSVGFVASSAPLPRRVDDDIRYVRTRLRGEHVRASAAIPMLFPSVRVESPRLAAGHYTDGGTRLNSPIKPALDLGAEKVIVIGLEPFARGGRPPAAGQRSASLSSVVANVLDGLLVDQVAQDLRRLATINSFFAESYTTGTIDGSRSYKLARGHAPYRPISYALVSPRRHGEIGRLADETFRRCYGGLRAVKDVDFALLARILGDGDGSRGEFLSFLLFDPHFVGALIDLGRRDAHRWLRRHPRFWCREAEHDLAFRALDRSRVVEQHAIDEFRARAR